nr:MAG TPA: hypothetical protein [Caudoviricetes sp.]
MTDKKNTDEEIIKVLECCAYNDGCKGCKYSKQCDGASYLIDALDLINRQNAEIERLKECPKCVYEYDGEVTEYCVQGPCSNFKTVEQIKTEAYKEFAEKLKEKHCDIVLYGEIVTVNTIDNLLKEMVGDEQ